MSEKVFSYNPESRYRVAYEMALQMWINSKNESPRLEDEGEFLGLVKRCTQALAFGSG